MRSRRLLLLVCTALVSFEGLSAQEDQTAKENQATQDAFEGEFATPEAIEARLKQARIELKQVDPKLQPKLWELLSELETTCLQHLNDVAFTKTKQAENQQAGAALQGWKGFPQAPPYSIRFLDELRMARVHLEAKAESVKSMVRVFTRSIEEERNQLQEHQQAGRRASESIGAGGGTGMGGDVGGSIVREDVSSRIAAERISRFIERQTGHRAELASIERKLELVSTQLEVAEKNVEFSRRELDQIMKKLAIDRAEAIKELNAAMAETKGDHELRGWKVTFLDRERSFWKQRFDALNSDDPNVKAAALKKFKEQLDMVDYWASIGEIRSAENGGREGQDERSVLIQDAERKIEGQKLRLKFAIAEISGGAIKSRAGTDRLVDILSSIWHLELYLAEQSVFIDGKKTVSYRAVTLGKVLQFLIILVIGYFLLHYLSRLLRKLLGKRGHTTAAVINLVSRTFFGTGLFLLLIYGLNIAHIPLTAFAFLGGALAIGVGFGTQTLLKNLISGIILGFERPFKVGDIVEAGGVIGKIQSIGIRASIVEHFDGIETLIPNSTLLEEQVTNWSLSNSLIRRTIHIGVAYGSPVREVSNKLLKIADDHGLVLDNPKPQVHFIDFGDNSLNFQLMFWIDGKTTSGIAVDSDIRFMIDRAFADAGIEIPFPQRDIHFDASQPLQVEWSRAASPGAKAPQ